MLDGTAAPAHKQFVQTNNAIGVFLWVRRGWFATIYKDLSVERPRPAVQFRLTSSATVDTSTESPQYCSVPAFALVT